LTDAEIRIITGRYLSISDPRLFILLMKGDEIAGYLFLIPDVSAALRRSGGRLFPTGWFHLMREVKHTRWLNLQIMGVHPAFWGTGANLIIYAEAAGLPQRVDYDHAHIVYIDEGNRRMLANAALLGIPLYKRHRIYRRDL
jgi:hypothetical protein